MSQLMVCASSCPLLDVMAGVVPCLYCCVSSSKSSFDNKPCPHILLSKCNQDVLCIAQSGTFIVTQLCRRSIALTEGCITHLSNLNKLLKDGTYV